MDRAGVDAGLDDAAVVDGGSPPAWNQRTIPMRRWYLAATLVVLNLLDVAFTKWILALGGEEGNPLMRPIIDHPTAPLVLKVGLCLAIGALLLACPPKSRVADTAMTVAVIVYTIVIGWNLSVLVQAAGLS
jgi:hypothetical protein